MLQIDAGKYVGQRRAKLLVTERALHPDTADGHL